MKIYRSGIYICFSLCFLCVVVLLIDVFNIPTRIGLLASSSSCYFEYKSIATSLFFGIFGSSFVVLITYSGAYYIEKCRTTNLVVYYCRRYIATFGDLLPLLVDVVDKDHLKYGWDDVKNIIETNEAVYRCIEKLTDLHTERFLGVSGYYPILKRNKKNLEVHNLIWSLANINFAIYYCQNAYKIKNNELYTYSRDELGFNDEVFKEKVEMLLQIEGSADDFEQFQKLLLSVESLSTGVTLETFNKSRCL